MHLPLIHARGAQCRFMAPTSGTPTQRGRPISITERTPPVSAAMCTIARCSKQIKAQFTAVVSHHRNVRELDPVSRVHLDQRD